MKNYFFLFSTLALLSMEGAVTFDEYYGLGALKPSLKLTISVVPKVTRHTWTSLEKTSIDRATATTAPSNIFTDFSDVVSPEVIVEEVESELDEKTLEENVLKDRNAELSVWEDTEGSYYLLETNKIYSKNFVLPPQIVLSYGSLFLKFDGELRIQVSNKAIDPHKYPTGRNPKIGEKFRALMNKNSKPFWDDLVYGGSATLVAGIDLHASKGSSLFETDVSPFAGYYFDINKCGRKVQNRWKGPLAGARIITNLDSDVKLVLSYAYSILNQENIYKTCPLLSEEANGYKVIDLYKERGNTHGHFATLDWIIRIDRNLSLGLSTDMRYIEAPSNVESSFRDYPDDALSEYTKAETLWDSGAFLSYSLGLFIQIVS